MSSVLWLCLAMFVLTTLFIVSVHFSLKRVHESLPPGTEGWLPFVGETLEYAIPNNGLTFLRRRIQRYGELFKSHLFGDRIIISCSSKVNRIILQEEFKRFRSCYPRSFSTIMGMNNISEVTKQKHKKLRSVVMSVLGSGVRDDEYAADISRIITRMLTSWEGRVVRVEEEVAKIAFAVTAKRLIGLTESDKEFEYLRCCYFCLIEGLVSIPLNIPGTAYNKSMKVRKKIVKFIEDTISKRKVNSRPVSPDFLDALIAEEEKPNSCVTREVTTDSMVSVMFAAHDTVSKAMTFALKLILDNPKVLEALQEEHKSISENASGGDCTLQYYKCMTVTHNVILETLRLSNIAPGVFRIALEDVDIEGYLIPRGWRVMANFSTIHLDPLNFQDPFHFNPWRWENTSIKDVDYMPFGGGPRLCPGSELAKLQMCIFLHQLVMRYRFKQVEEDEIMYTPYMKFKKGLPVLFEKLESTSMDKSAKNF